MDVCVDSCTAHTSFYYHVLDIKTGPETCGGKGGNGGNGGPGGPAGGVTIISMQGNADLKAYLVALLLMFLSLICCTLVFLYFCAAYGQFVLFSY